MDRQIIYADAIPLDTDQLLQNRNAMIALGFAVQAILGTNTIADGLACTPTSPATMTVNVGPGSIYSLQNVDNSAYGSLAPDTSDQIMKQGIVQSIANFSCPAPSTSGFSIAYLIEASYQDQDGGSVVLPYYNASDPAVAYNGPNNTGVSQNTVRKGVCVLTLKTGTAATTGTQVLPAADVGAVPVASITIANGQTTITSGNIAQLTGSFINTKLPGVLAAIQSGACVYAQDTSGSGGTITASLTPALGSYTAGLTVCIKSANNCAANAVMNLNGLGNKSIYDTTGNPVSANEILANSVNIYVYDGTNMVLQSPPGYQYSALGQCYLKFTSATLITLSPTNGNRVSFPSGTVQSIGGGITAANTGIHIDGVGSQNLAASTQYYVYLVAGGSPFLDFSTTAYAIDSSSGIAIKNSDGTRVLVGRVTTNPSSQFEDQDGFLGVYSHFNRQRKRSRTNFSTARSTSSTSLVEINSEIRNSFAPWSGDLVEYFITGGVLNSGTATTVTGIGFDGTTPEPEASSFGTAASNGTVAIAGNKSGLSEAVHYATLLGMVNGSTGTWDASTTNSSSEIVLNIVVKG